MPPSRCLRTLPPASHPPERRVLLPELPGLLAVDELRETASSIARAQEASGAIPWYAGGHTDPWDHVECAMALAVAGFHREARAAYRMLQRTQRPDGSWPSRVRAGRIEEPGFETNQCAYVAVGVWHQLLVTGDVDDAAEMWPTVRAALDLVTRFATDRGEIRWAVDAAGAVSEGALLTGSASTCHALRCGLALAERLDDPQPEWEITAGRLRHVIDEHPEAFLDKQRYSMDWYYPVLGGAVVADDARNRLRERWHEFVVPGLGVRCVSDQPWVTGAETAELVLALAAVGEVDRGVDLLGD